MKNLILTVLLFSCLFSINAQFTDPKKPDYEAIKKTIQDERSSNYYPKLLARFQALDTTLTSDDYINLYFGYVFQKKYKPYDIIPEEREFRAFLKSANPSPADLDKMIEVGNAYRKKFPFNSDVAKYLSMAYEKKNDNVTARKLFNQTMSILKTILNSGDGKTQETAFHVLTVGNEYEVISTLSLPLESQSLVGRNFDYLKFKQNRYNVEGFYFNIEKMRDTQK